MTQPSRHAHLETGNGWMRIRSPRFPFPLWLLWAPVVVLAVAGFWFYFLWIAAGFFALVGGINYAYAVNAYPEFEVFIDFDKREIAWSGTGFNTANLYGLSSYSYAPERISLDQIDDIVTGLEMLKLPCLVLVLKNREQVLLSTFESLWSRDKVLSEIGSHLQRRNI